MQVGNRPDGSQTSGSADDGQKEREDNRPLLSWRAALVIMAVGLVVLLGGGSLVVRQVLGTRGEPVGTVPATIATPVARQTQAPTVNSTPAPTVASARTTAELPATGVAIGSAPSSITPTSQAATNVAAASTSDQQLEDQVATAYLNYWDVTALAFWNFDPSHLEEVSTDEELAGLRRDIDQLKNEGRAIKSEVQHQYAVLSINGDEAQVRDRLRDFSIYVDAASKQPLAGQARPQPQDAPLNTTVYRLKKQDGIWKVSKGDPDANN